MSSDERSFVRLTALTFQVLLAMADQPRHGYAIIREVEERTSGSITLRSGTLYTLLQRLLKEAWIDETTDRPPAGADDPRRRYYRLTPMGRRILTAEAQRLAALVAEARRKQVLKKGEA